MFRTRRLITLDNRLETLNILRDATKKCTPKDLIVKSIKYDIFEE